MVWTLPEGAPAEEPALAPALACAPAPTPAPACALAPAIADDPLFSTGTDGGSDGCSWVCDGTLWGWCGCWGWWPAVADTVPENNYKYINTKKCSKALTHWQNL